MILKNELTVPADPDTVYALLQDTERVVQCLPGATLVHSDGDTHEGRVRIKVGPVTANYQGTVRFVESDAAKHRLRLSARGQDTKGNGDAEAAVSIEIEATQRGSRISIETDLSIRGRLAQFGQSAIGPVSQRLLNQFEANISQMVSGAPASSASPADGAVASTQPENGSYTVPAAAAAAPAASGHLDALSLILSPEAQRQLKVALVAGLGVVTGYMYGRAVTIERTYRRSERHR